MNLAHPEKNKPKELRPLISFRGVSKCFAGVVALRSVDELASAGHAILMISSELPEILHLSTQGLVMRQGRVTGMVNRADATEESLMQLMAGKSKDPGTLDTTIHAN